MSYSTYRIIWITDTDAVKYRQCFCCLLLILILIIIISPAALICLFLNTILYSLYLILFWIKSKQMGWYRVYYYYRSTTSFFLSIFLLYIYIFFFYWKCFILKKGKKKKIENIRLIQLIQPKTHFFLNKKTFFYSSKLSLMWKIQWF